MFPGDMPISLALCEGSSAQGTTSTRISEAAQARSCLKGMQGNMVIHISFPLFLYWRLLALNQAISRYIHIEIDVNSSLYI